MNIIRHVVEINGHEEISNVPFTDILSIELNSKDGSLTLLFRYGSTAQDNILIYYDNYKVLEELEKDLVNYYVHLSPNNEVLGFESSDKIFEIREKRECDSECDMVEYEGEEDEEDIEATTTTKLTWEIKTNL